MPADSQPSLHIVVLAAGKGTRMKSALPKVLHHAAGAPLIDHVLGAAAPLAPDSVIVVIGHQTEQVQAHLTDSGVQTAVQEPQLGTGHALLQAEPFLRGKTGTLLLLSGDVPLLRPATVAQIQANAHSGERMPPKTTFFHPKPKTGIVFRDLT